MAPNTHEHLRQWLTRGWTLAEDTDHPLGQLSRCRLGQARLLPLLGPANRYGARFFLLFLQDQEGSASLQPVVSGLHSSGYRHTYNWIEVSRLSGRVSFPSGEELSVAAGERARELLGCLARLIPPGGHLMVEYDSPEQEETARGLLLDVPPAATPLGQLLFLAGCGAGFKDWYFAEGGSEGPRKLQGHKPLNEEHKQTKLAELAQELRAFLDRTSENEESPLIRDARQRARDVLATLP